MPSPTAQTETRRPGGHYLRPAALVYLALVLVALVAGVWPRAIYEPGPVRDALLPALQALAAGQAVFLILVLPPMLWRRRERGEQLALAAVAMEWLVLLVLTSPLYLAGAWLGNATGLDVARSALVTLPMAALAMAAGRVGRRWQAAAMLTLLVLSVGLIGWWYIAQEFLLWHSGAAAVALSPPYYAWRAAEARQAGVVPLPWWPWAAWAMLAAAGLLATSRASKPRLGS
jgi:hypothetical protein